MGLIQNLINHHNEKKKISTHNLYYGFIYSVNPKNSIHGEISINPIDLNNENDENFVVMQRLTNRERNAYLKSKYQTFLDSENCELHKYLTIKNSDTQFYRIPSMNNQIVAETTSANIMRMLAPQTITLDAISLYKDFNIKDDYINLSKIHTIEQMLNANQQQTYYFTENYQMLEF